MNGSLRWLLFGATQILVFLAVLDANGVMQGDKDEEMKDDVGVKPPAAAGGVETDEERCAVQCSTARYP